MPRIAEVAVDKGLCLTCLTPVELAIHEGDYCVADSAGALEFGRVAKLHDVESVEDERSLPRVLRRATLQDQSKAKENAVYLKMATDACYRQVEKHKLNMQIINVRHSFDRKVLTLTYVAEERVPFRDMIRDLGAELNARVEMCQIGVRDAAGVIGGLGPCGRTLCCNTWLHGFEAVSVRMAKTQRLSLNPSTISGVCGRLKCCLRFENDCYSELAKSLPRDGALVTCPQGPGCVIDKNILAQRVKVRFEDGRVSELAASEVVARKPQSQQ